ncbi:hypothetical protein L3X38_000797 [Prunus dulcis]|uniref:Uncharacterized protein n=1 Tax=Prunus dulcis TaxID=3755 RepID=A0AAD4WQU3_PRUDU|nr:hypothetical protein L3X38_000797 [Prunus dulcis]
MSALIVWLELRTSSNIIVVHFTWQLKARLEMLLNHSMPTLTVWYRCALHLAIEGSFGDALKPFHVSFDSLVGAPNFFKYYRCTLHLTIESSIVDALKLFEDMLFFQCKDLES